MADKPATGASLQKMLEILNNRGLIVQQDVDK
jgi:hypothetical protein